MIITKNQYAIIMAGGVGSRFWPVSTSEFPKQFHDMLGSGKSLLQHTFSRLSRSISTENIFILTNAQYIDLVLTQLSEIQQTQIISEPTMRNTAPCILYASLKIYKQNPEAQIIVAPSDHWIENESLFDAHLQKAFQYCNEHNALMTFGIVPTFPNTGYGYIEYDKNSTTDIHKVVQFREKPDFNTAKTFLEAGNFLWNAGIFVWNAKCILEAFQDYQPEMYALFFKGFEVLNTDKEAEFILENYPKAENISVDYAVLEKANNVYVLPSNFDWNDLGTWSSLYDKLPKNNANNAMVKAQLFTENAENNMVFTHEKKLVVLGDLNNYIVVDNKDVLLIYPKHKEQDIKQLVAKINNNK